LCLRVRAESLAVDQSQRRKATVRSPVIASQRRALASRDVVTMRYERDCIVIEHLISLAGSMSRAPQRGTEAC
jgi:hypothetical protein